MRRLGWLFIVLAFAVPVFSQSPEVDALLDTVLAKDIDTAAKHLPPNLQKALAELPSQQREQIAANLLISRRMQHDGLKMTRSPGYDVLLALEEPRGDSIQKIEFRLEKKISDGNEAVLRISVRTPGEEFKKAVEVWMRYEDGDWRVFEVSESVSDVMNLDDPKLLDEIRGIPREGHSESSAVGSLRSYNTAIVTYESTYPDTSLPASFDVLGPPAADTNPSEFHAGLIDSVLSTPPYQKSGYQFTYRRLSSSEYEITARPIQFGTTGKRSFFTNQTGVIRATKDDREPTADDEPLR